VTDAIVALIEAALSSPWGLLGIVVVAAVDGFFPVVPSESLVVTAGAFAAGGDQSLALIIAAGALGAFSGDHISYFVGRRAGDKLAGRLRPGTRKAAAYKWAQGILAERGGTVLIVARYVPGGRTAVTLTAGAVRYPLSSFSLYDSIAAVSWATYAALVGHLGGAAFEDEPLKGVLLGLGLALGIAAAIELIRHVRRRRPDMRGRLGARRAGWHRETSVSDGRDARLSGACFELQPTPE
jgi:membrane-associated protein